MLTAELGDNPRITEKHLNFLGTPITYAHQTIWM